MSQLIFKNLTFQVFLAALLGIGLGMTFDEVLLSPQGSTFYEVILLIKTVFLSALRMLIAPLIFFSLITGIIGIGSVVKLRQLGALTITYYLSKIGRAHV